MSAKKIYKGKEKFAVRSLKGVGYWFLGEFMCFFVCATLLVFMKSMLFLKLFISLCTAALTLGLFFNWAHYAAISDKNSVKFHGMEYDRHMPLKMAVIGPIFSYIMLICLYLSKLGVIPDIYRFYLWLNVWILPFVTLFAGAEQRTNIEFLTGAGLAGITALVLVQPVVIYASYILTYKEIDVAKILMYKKDKKQ
ncbi:MAG: hypothetical protein J6C96_10395 [Oscillospiraceae bacterium]|nr:hypothetical protein [Oscillospiraceae bacterium]